MKTYKLEYGGDTTTAYLEIFKNNKTTNIFVYSINDPYKPFGLISNELNLPCEKDELYIQEPITIHDWKQKFLLNNHIAIKIKNTTVISNNQIYNKFKLK